MRIPCSDWYAGFRTSRPAPHPRVLGINDFALKKGHVYGTIILDMETGERIDVLPDRTAETLTAWLRAHPGAEIVRGDRASAYAEAVRTARPDAIQVADRFHLWKNLCEAVEKRVATYRGRLAEPTEDAPAAAAAPDQSERPEGMRVIRRRERHAAVHALYDKGVPVQAICETLGLDRKTVRRYAHAATPEDASLGTGSRRYGQIHAYSPYLHRRWNEGRTDAARLHTEIAELGFTGSKRTVRRHLQEIRASGKSAPDKPKTLTVRTATWLITSHPDHLDENSTLKLKKPLSRSPELDAVASCVRSFAAMMTERRGSDLENWLTSAEDAGMKPLQSLARGPRQDFDAVTAGLTLEWSSGKVEGNVNRVKRIKRDGYGRAGFDLLSLQILLADCCSRSPTRDGGGRHRSGRRIPPFRPPVVVSGSPTGDARPMSCRQSVTPTSGAMRGRRLLGRTGLSCRTAWRYHATASSG
ncbi:ISL3 family transposase [Streptomyces vinaceus]